MPPPPDRSATDLELMKLDELRARLRAQAERETDSYSACNAFADVRDLEVLLDHLKHGRDEEAGLHVREMELHMQEQVLKLLGKRTHQALRAPRR